MPEGHDLKFCKLPACDNELDGTEPSRGVWANICVPCRKGETAMGVVYRERHGYEGKPGVTSDVPRPGGKPNPIPGRSLEALAKRVVPLAKTVEKHVGAHKQARIQAKGSATEFLKALTELRDAAQALIGGVVDDR